jgi:voltage-gated potassium channel
MAGARKKRSPGRVLGGCHDRVLPHHAALGARRSRRLRRDPQFRSLVFLVIITLVGGTIFYSSVEGWSVVDALYFSVTTLTTVGLGDLTPKTTIAKLFTVVYIFAGLSIVLGFIDTVAKETLSVRQRRGAVVGKAKEILPRVRPGPATP